MGIEMCPHGSPSSRGMSPRLSFSQEFNQTDGVPVEQPLQSPLLLESADFVFCLRPSFHDLESSSADELFSNGVILPAHFKERQPLYTKSKSTPPPPSPPPPLPPPPPPPPAMILPDEGDDKLDPQHQQTSNTKSFWGFTRSRSFNCGSFNGRGLCPLPLLSRSKSTGSSDSIAKRSLVPKEDRQNHLHSHHHHHHHHHGTYYKQSTQKNSAPSSQRFSSHQRPPLKKNYSGQLGNNGVTVNPVLNMPSTNLFGLGSIFSLGKDKAKKK
ncbi:hypothetical protein Dimus_034042 [Dionaea muscipula]